MTIDRTLAKAYEPHDVEKRWYAAWESQGCFHAELNNGKPSYSIVIPPPNVTGALHMGHALNNTLQDILCRWKRMQGYNVLWMPGTDHAGIATQNVVERQLAAAGQDRHALGREDFIKRVWQWKAESGGQIIGQLKRLGASCDWERERFTMDAGLSTAVRTVFVKLYEDGLIYRANRLINWCPRCHTALSDIEVEHEEAKGHLWHIRYPVVGAPGRFVVVATTRPETMLGDTAVAVHPEDERYADLIGQHVRLPLVDREIPVIADAYVDRAFGTGVVKITPAHDFNDFEVGQRHGLDQINILDESGNINAAGRQYEGLERFAARAKIVADLDALGLLEKIDEHALSIGGCYRCKTVVEPYLSLQWYVKTGPLAERALAAVRAGETRILPEQWEKNYYEWMENIHDWCISRQIWWGHRIPAWYCDHCGAVTVAMTDPAHCCQCGSDEMRQETDVLDTWFSSALWPFSTMGWPEKTAELAAFYPTSCLVTGFDILFFWVARMMMMGLHFMDQVPFKEVYIHALVRDAHGQKMSKSKGNVIDPLVIIDEYGADAFRFTLTAFAAMGRDIKLATERIAGYRAFANKLWNAARFTLMNLEGFTPAPEGLASMPLSLPDHWILKRLNLTAAQVNVALTEYKFNEVASLLYAFTWNDFCDWYIELVKDDLYGSDAVAKLRAQTVLYTVLEALLRLLHPLMPFITEEIWQSLPGTRPTTTIMYAPYPDGSGLRFDDASAGEMEQIMEIIRAIRNIRGEMDVNPGRQISVVFDCRNEGDLAVTRAGERYIRTLARVKEQLSAINVVRPDQVATQVAGGIEILVPLAGLIDVAAEIERLGKEIAKVQKDVEMFEKKLGNEAFVARAPAEVLEKDRAKLADATEKLAILNASRAKIQALDPSR